MNLQSFDKLEQHFDYVKISLASPEKIRQWGTRKVSVRFDYRSIFIECMRRKH